jgi:hypothetical protein
VHDETGATNSSLAICDTIEHEGQFWLVPEWIPRPAGGKPRPARLIRPAADPFLPAPLGHPADFRLERSIPKGVFAGRIPPQGEDEILVLEAPDIEHEGPSGAH